MSRENFLSDEPWTDAYGDAAIRSRVFERHLGAMLGASLHELAPGAPGFKLHMHYGEPVRILAVSAGRFPDVVAYPEHGYAWVATRDPEFPAPDGGDGGIIARFELPSDPQATS